MRKFQKWLYSLHMNPIAIRRNVKSDFRIQPRNVIVVHTCVNQIQENVALRRTLTKMTTHYFADIRAIPNIFADINHQYILLKL